MFEDVGVQVKFTGVLDGGVTRLDYSLNSATTFPMNDAPAFAAFIRLVSAPGIWKKLAVLWSFTLKDHYRFMQTAVLGILQQRQTPLIAYQQLTYWSTVPFRFGRSDAIQYAATANPSNPSKLGSRN